ncbi:MAG: GGDEF domain-containing protein [Phycisphaerales bacterium]
MPIDEGQVEQGVEIGRGGSGMGSGWRVILVGRTGLDQVMRRVSGVELIRTRDSFDAIGELSDPIDDASPARAAVLVSPDAEPTGGEDNGEGNSEDGGELAKFIEALRMVDSRVKVIRVGAPHALYDGSVGPQDTAAQVMAVIEGSVSMPRVEVVVSKSVVEEPIVDAVIDEALEEVVEVETAAEKCTRENAAHDAENVREVTALHQRVMAGGGAAVHSESADMGKSGGTDEAVIRAMGEGRSVVDVAVKLINTRIGRNDVSFTTEGADDGVAVHAGGRVFGSLVCKNSSWIKGVGARVLSEHAAWLGSWMRLEEQQRALRLAAFTDELTGAWNRRYFSRFLDAAIEQARGARRTLTLLYFDIDDFKGYNDRYGHAAGDEILVETVRLLESVIRPGDKVCRIGGDEFVVIFYEPKGPRDPGSSPPESIYGLATRFQKQICNHRFPKLGDDACGTLTVSGGLASYPWDGSDGESLLAIADELALKSKRSGKNVITLGRGAEGVCGVECDPE